MARRTPPMATVALLAAGLLGCDTLFPAPGLVEGPADAVLQSDGSLGADADASEDSADATSCSCPLGQVMHAGPCVPTYQLGCGPGCEGKARSACPSEAICDETAAHVPCDPATPAAACVPSQAMQIGAGALRVTPRTVAIGETVELRVQGAHYYIGALMWWVRADQEVLTANEYELQCTLKAPWTPTKAGVVPIYAYYGGPPPDQPHPGWGFAGFVRVGDGPALRGQPGEACSVDADCEATAAVPCACSTGRCACSTSP